MDDVVVVGACDVSRTFRVYCSSCVRRLAGEEGEQAVRDASPWHCYCCQPRRQTSCGFLSARRDWRDRIISLFAPADTPPVSSWARLYDKFM